MIICLCSAEQTSSPIVCCLCQCWPQYIDNQMFDSLKSNYIRLLQRASNNAMLGCEHSLVFLPVRHLE